MASPIDFSRLADEKEKRPLHSEDQHHQETTVIVPVPVPDVHKQPRVKAVETQESSLDLNQPPSEETAEEMVVDGKLHLFHEEVVNREKLLKKPRKVESSSDDDDVHRQPCVKAVETRESFLDLNQPPPEETAEEMVVDGEVHLFHEEVMNREKLLKKPMEVESSCDDDDVHRQPFVKAVETRESFLDLNQPPPEETAEEKEQETNKKNKKRKGDSDDGGIKKARSPFKKAVDDGPNPPPELPQKVMVRIRERAQSQGRDNVDDGKVNLVTQKRLTASDLAVQQNRFIYTKHQLRSEFLSDEEEKLIRSRNENNHHNGIEVPLIEPSTQVEHVNFTKWKRGKNIQSYVLNRYWKKVVNKNHLLQGQVVQLWAFRIGGKLHFALVVLPGEVNASNA